MEHGTPTGSPMVTVRRRPFFGGGGDVLDICAYEGYFLILHAWKGSRSDTLLESSPEYL